MKKAITQMIQSLLLSLAARSQLQELREKLRLPAVDKGPVLKAKPPAAQKDILGVCCDPLVLAQQLTHIELVSAPHGQADGMSTTMGPGLLPELLSAQGHGDPAGHTGDTGLLAVCKGSRCQPALGPRSMAAWE